MRPCVHREPATSGFAQSPRGGPRIALWNLVNVSQGVLIRSLTKNPRVLPSICNMVKQSFATACRQDLGEQIRKIRLGIFLGDANRPCSRGFADSVVTDGIVFLV